MSLLIQKYIIKKINKKFIFCKPSDSLKFNLVKYYYDAILSNLFNKCL